MNLQTTSTDTDPVDPQLLAKMVFATSVVTNALRAAVLRAADPATLAKCDELLRGGGRIGVAIYTDASGKVSCDLTGAEIEGRRVLFGEIV